MSEGTAGHEGDGGCGNKRKADDSVNLEDMRKRMQASVASLTDRVLGIDSSVPESATARALLLGATAPSASAGSGVAPGAGNLRIPSAFAQRGKPVVQDKGDLPAGIAAMFKNRPSAQGPKPMPPAALESLRRAADEANAKRNGNASVPVANLGGNALQPPLGASVASGLSSGLMQAEIQAELALHTQLMQRHRFQIEMRNYEAKQDGQTVYYGRFREGMRPIQLCRSMQQYGMCQRGEACTYAHTMEELHPASADLHKVEAVANVPSGAATAPTEQVPEFLNAMPQMQMKKKREICQRMSGHGCLLAERCKFAHSEEELGKVCLVIVDDRVKRTLCRFWESGRRCSYGKYCVNAHGMEEVGRLKPPENLCPSGPRHG